MGGSRGRNPEVGGRYIVTCAVTYLGRYLSHMRIGLLFEASNACLPDTFKRTQLIFVTLLAIPVSSPHQQPIDRRRFTLRTSILLD